MTAEDALREMANAQTAQEFLGAPPAANLAVVADARNVSPVQAAPQIATGPPTFAQPKTLAELREVAEMMASSGFFKDVRSASQACVKMIAGMALGYDMVTAMNAFHIIEGKLTLTAGEVGARVKRSGKYNYRLKNAPTPDVCTITFLERDGDKWLELGDSTFTIQDAILAGLASKNVWKNYARNMLFSRALTNGCRWYCPDVFGGPVYTPEELGAEVDIVDGEMVVVGEQKAIETDRKPLTSKQIRALYVDARKLDPSLPEDIKVWLTANVDGMDPLKPKPAEMIAAEDKLRELLANGAGSETPSGAAVAPPTLGEAPPQTDSAGVQPAADASVSTTEVVEGELLEYAAAKLGAVEPAKPIENRSEPAQDSLLEPRAAEPSPAVVDAPQSPETAPEGPPANDGPLITASTRGRLFANLGKLGVKGKLQGASGALYDAKHVWLTQFGIECPKDESGKESFAAIRENLGRWLADRAAEQVKEKLLEEAKAKAFDPDAECPACGYEGGAHGDNCPEANPSQ